MKILTIPCLKDNLSYLVHQNGRGFLVDVPEASPILNTLSQEKISLEGIIITHGHWDHIYELPLLAPHCKGPIYGMQHPKYPIKNMTHPLTNELPFTCAGINIQPLKTPGHMPAHYCYFLPDHPALFSGDVLFSLGCGRVFDGTADQLYQSLQRLMRLPDQTELYCGHEYTLSNGAFAKTVLDDQSALDIYLSQVNHKYEQGLSSMPSTLYQEKKLNPFLRVKESAFSLDYPDKKPAEIFAYLRHKKDLFSVKSVK